MPPSRRSSSPTAKHADIQTPSWRPFVPGAPPAQETFISSDETSDEVYERLHAAPLAEERARWAPPAPSPSSAGPSNKTRGIGRPAPLFPTPAESVALVRRAVRVARKRPRRLAHIRIAARDHALAALARFDHTLAAYADVEAFLERRCAALQGDLPALQAAAEQPAPAAPTFRLPAAATRRASADPPPLGDRDHDVHVTAAVCTVAEGALADLDDLELIMREKSKALADRVAAMAQQAHISLRTPITCKTLRMDIAKAKKLARRRADSLVDDDGDHYSLSECIRREIDPKLYPVLAKTFRLHPEYRLDGTRRPLEELDQYGADPLHDPHAHPDDAMHQDDHPIMQANGVSSMDNLDGYALDIDALETHSEDKDPDFIVNTNRSMLDSSDPMEVLSDSNNPIQTRRSPPRAQSKSKANGSTPKGSSHRRPGRPRKKKPASAPRATAREKREKKSFRIPEKNAELISSDPSEPSDTMTPSFGGSRFANASSMPAPMQFHHVVDCDTDENAIDIPMAVVELDNDSNGLNGHP